MTRATLSSADVRGVLDLVGHLHDAPDPDQLSLILLRRLPTVVRSDLISFNDIDLTGRGRTTTCYEPELVPQPQLEQVFDALQHQHPLICDYAATGDPAPRRMSDFISLPRLRALDLWQEVFRPLETNFQVGLVATLSGERLVAMGLNRLRRDFTDRDMAVVELLRQHLAAAYGHARLRALLDSRADDRLAPLSPREREVLALIATGLSNQQIARTLHIGCRTVDKHAENLRAKLGVRSRTEAAAIYLRSSPTGRIAQIPRPRRG